MQEERLVSFADRVRIAEPWRRAPADLVVALGGFPVANIGDAMERLGMCDGGIAAVWSGARAVGTVLPVLTSSGDNAAVIEALEYAQEGDLLVVNGFGHTHRALVGDQLARRYAAQGVTGAVIDGAVRDRDTIAALRFPVWARATTPAGPFKNGPGVIGEPVAVGGIVASAGDVVVADGDGVIVVPAARAAAVLAAVRHVFEHEQRLHAEVAAAYA
jgi:regulator of RNase E activity RraA